MKNQAGKLLTSLLLAFQTHSFGQSIEVASKPIRPEPAGLGDSGPVEFNPEGTLAAFLSTANNLVPGDKNGLVLDLFVRDLQANTTRLITPGGTGHTGEFEFSPDGKFLLFSSGASNLVPNDTNGMSDLFLHELATGKTELISLNTAGEQANKDSAAGRFSPDGKLVLFESSGSNLTANDTNLSADIFIRDLAAKTTSAVTVNQDNSGTYGGFFPQPGSMNAQFSPDGQKVVFETVGTNLVPGTTSTTPQQVYVRDLAAGTTTLVSTGSQQAPANQPASNAQFSPDSTMVSFFSAANNLTAEPVTSALAHAFQKKLGVAAIGRLPLPPGETIGQGFESLLFSPDGTKLAVTVNSHLYLQDLTDGSYTLVSRNGDGTAADGYVAAEQFSEDGNLLLYTSEATDIEDLPEGNGFLQLYLYDITADSAELVTRNTAGESAGHDSFYPVMSGDGTEIAFVSMDSDLVSNDSNNSLDIFLWREAGEIQFLNTASGQVVQGTGNGTSSSAKLGMSADGKKVLYRSSANNLVDGDKNSLNLVVYDVPGRLNQIVTSDSANDPAEAPAIEGRMNQEGRYVVFSSIASDLVPNDTNAVSDIFRKDLVTGQVDLVSRNLEGNVPAEASSAPQISADGNVIAFQSMARLTAEGSPGLFVRFMREGVTRLLGGTTELLNGSLMPNGTLYVNSRGLAHNISPTDPITTFALSTDASLSVSKDFHPANLDTLLYSRSSELRMFDLASKISTVVGVNINSPGLSANSQFVAFERRVLSPLKTTLSLFDRAENKEVELVDLSAPSNSGLNALGIDGTGRFIVFSTMVPLSSGDLNEGTDVYLHDRSFNSTILISRNADGKAGNGFSVAPSISAQGGIIAFTSSASDLVENDVNNLTDLFVYRMGVADSDSDGLDDNWEITWFGNLQETATGDADGDGMTNAAEFSAGTSPKDGESVLEVYNITNLRNGSISLLWNSVAGKKYQLQFKEEITADWQNLGEVFSAAATSTEKIDSPVANRFYRVMVVP